MGEGWQAVRDRLRRRGDTQLADALEQPRRNWTWTKDQLRGLSRRERTIVFERLAGRRPTPAELRDFRHAPYDPAAAVLIAGALAIMFGFWSPG